MSSPADPSLDRVVSSFHLPSLEWLLQGIKKAKVWGLEGPVFLRACTWIKFCALWVVRMARREGFKAVLLSKQKNKIK